MTEIMPSLQNLIKLSYDSPGLQRFYFFIAVKNGKSVVTVTVSSASASLEFLLYSAAVTEVIWGFTPSYQYRKPSISITSPI